MEATKLYSVKMINLAVILYTMYMIQRYASSATKLIESDGADGLEDCDEEFQECDIGLVCCDSICVSRFDSNFQVNS